MPDPNRWKALAVCLVGGSMVLLDVSIVNVALHSINVGLHASGDAIQWVLSGYSLTFGLLLVPAVPVDQAGTAGGLIQVGQRIGASIGIAAVGSVFYAQLSASRGDYSQALQHGLLVAVLFLVLALALAVGDALLRQRPADDVAGGGPRAAVGA